jgi:PASTA domain-containing protein
MECAMLDPLIETAVTEKEDEQASEVDVKDMLAELEKLDRRMVDLDKRVWPEIARSADPFPGADYDPESDIPITQAYLKSTSEQRKLLTLIVEAARVPSPANDNALRQYLAAGVEEGQLPRQISSLDDLARGTLRDILDIVREYEAAYDKILAILAETNEYVKGRSNVPTSPSAGAGAEGLTIGPPYHLRLDPGKESGIKIPSDDLEPRVQAELTTLPNRPGALDVLAAEDWQNKYKQQYDKVRNDLGGRLEAFHTRLRPLVTTLDLPGAAADTVARWLDWWNGTGSYEQAFRHPYSARLLRLRFQINELDDMQPGADEATAAEIAAAVTPMVVGKKKGKDLLKGRAKGGAVIAALKAEMEQEYERLLKLSEGMFEMAVATEPADDLRVTDALAATLENRRNKELNGPDAAEIKELVQRYWWELVPTSAGEPADPQCVYVSNEWFWFSEFADAPGQGTKSSGTPEKAKWRKRLLQAGPYLLRVTALGADDVPLAQIARPLELTVKPAELVGKLEVTGDWPRDGGGDRQVGIFLGLAGSDEPWPRFRIGKAGDFSGPVCSFKEAQLPSAIADGQPATGSFPPEPFASYAGVETSAVRLDEFMGVPHAPPLDPRSKPVSVTFGQRGRLKLDAPLILNFPQQIAVDVQVKDASGEAVSNAEITVHGGETTAATPAALQLQLTAEDEVYADVRYDTGAFVVERRSATVRYDPKIHPGVVTIKVVLPFFDTGHLRVAGRFVPQGGSQSRTVAGGIIRPNVTGEQAAPGGQFEFTNDGPVRLSDDLKIAAMVWADDDSLWKPAEGMVTRSLKQGAVFDLGDIPVAPAELLVEGIRISARDWTQQPLPDAGTHVSLRSGDGVVREAVRSGTEYVGSWTFKKRREEVEIQGEYAMPAGAPVTDATHLSLEQCGDLFKPAPPKTPVEMRLKLYLPGSLKLRGRTEVVPVAGSVPPTSGVLTVTADDAPTLEELPVSLGSSFESELKTPIRVGDAIKVAAAATVASDNYAGDGSSLAPTTLGPERLGIADLGVIRLIFVPPMLEVPVVVGMNIEAATKALADAGFAVSEQQPAMPPAEREQSRIVYKQVPMPEAGGAAHLQRGGTVSVWAYDEFKPVIVPDVTTQKLEAAAGVIAAVGLSPGRTSLGPAGKDQKPLVVVSQAPEGGAEANRGSTVTLSFFDPAVDPISGLDPRWLGPWRGDVRLTEASIGEFTATDFAALKAEVLKMVAQKKRGGPKAGEEESQLAVALGTAFGAIADALNEAVTAAVLAGASVAYDGGTVGFVFEPVKNGLRILVPGMPEKTKNEIYGPKSPWRPFRLIEERTLEMESATDPLSNTAEMSIVITFTANEDYSKGHVRLVVAARNRQSKSGNPGRAELTVEGDVVRGEMAFNDVTAGFQQKYAAAVPPLLNEVKAALGSKD